jgi:hypothetical protein
MNTGGYFEAHSTYGRGVYGWAHGVAGRGIEGYASYSGPGSNIGGFFEASSVNGVGAYGYATGTKGRGVYGHADGTDGRGVYGHAGNTGDVVNYGGYFEASGWYGSGVYGYASGVYGRGVHGYADGGDAGLSGVGVYGSSSGTSGYGLFGSAMGDSGTGVHGEGGLYDFYAHGSKVNFYPFTGAHETMLCEDFPVDTKPGMIVSVTGQTQLRRQGDGTPSLSSTLPTIKLSSRVADKAVFGVLVAEAPLPKGHWYEAKEGERFASVNALGEGRAWVSNINGDIEVGDYITTSSIPGYGQRQDDDLLHSYTFGKAIEAVDWSSVTETVLFNGREIKVYLIAVTYTSG